MHTFKQTPIRTAQGISHTPSDLEVYSAVAAAFNRATVKKDAWQAAKLEEVLVYLETEMP